MNKELHCYERWTYELQDEKGSPRDPKTPEYVDDVLVYNAKVISNRDGWSPGKTQLKRVVFNGDINLRRLYELKYESEDSFIVLNERDEPMYFIKDGIMRISMTPFPIKTPIVVTPNDWKTN